MRVLIAALALSLSVASCSSGGDTVGPDTDGPEPGTDNPGNQDAGTWAFLGDSSSDEYRADDDRPAFNYTELLAASSDGSPRVPHNRAIDAGRWGRRSEPRREGFEFLWARSGSTMVGVVEDQLPGVVEQVREGLVTHAYLSATGNEWATQAPFLMRTIYDSPDGGVTGSNGVAVETMMNALFDLYAECIDSLAPILPGGLVVTMPAQWQELPQVRAALSDARRRAYVRDAIDRLNARIEAHAAGVNASAQRTVVVTTTYDALLRDHYATDDGRSIEVAGVRLVYTSDAPDGEPEYLLIAPDSRNGSPHLGTVANGVIANTFIEAANRLPDVSITPFTDQEIRENAGLDG